VKVPGVDKVTFSPVVLVLQEIVAVVAVIEGVIGALSGVTTNEPVVVQLLLLTVTV
jgi:hypothetical protein